MSAVGTSLPYEEHTPHSAAAEITFSYLATEVRICLGDISGGKALEATVRD